MREYKLAEGEARFAELIWQKEPIASPELVKLCEKEFQDRKSTRLNSSHGMKKQLSLL